VRILQKLILGVVLLILSPATFAQKTDLRIVRSNHEVTAVIGQIVEVGLEGIDERRAPSLPVERFEVVVRQNGDTFAAAVRGATPTLTVGPDYAEYLSKAREVPNPQELAANLKPLCLLSFTVPLGLVPGEATLNVTYKGSKRSDDFNFRIVDLLPTPRIITSVAVYSGDKPKALSPEQIKNLRGPGIKIRRGEDLQLNVKPLIDPETPGSVVLVTFKQGSLSREVKARVARKAPVQRDENGLNFSPMWYEVMVRPPDELSEGPVDIEVRLSINSKLSEPGTETATVMAPDTGNDNDSPRILEIGHTKIGPGQATQLVVNRNDSTADPSEFVVILEQDSSRKIIKPERALSSKYPGISAPMILFFRAPAELRGKFTISVADLSRALKTKSANGIELEIGEEVLPPIITRIIEASKQDIGMLAAMREEALRSGHEFREYDPSRRYVTIQATGIDYEATHVRIRFSQGNRAFLLGPDDFSLSLGDRRVVRVPEGIMPGQVLITVQNIGFDKTSDPATGIVEITQPPRKR